MNELRLITGIKARNFINSITERSVDRIARNVAYIVIATLFVVGMFAIFLAMFSYLQTDADVLGPILTARILRIAFLSFFSLLVISNIITSLSTLYRSSEVVYLFSTPMTHLNVFITKFIENVFFSSWAILMLGIPIVAAYGLIVNAPFYFYPWILLIFIPFVLISASWGVSFTIILTRLFSHQRARKWLTGGLFLSGISVAIYAYLTRPRRLVIGDTDSLLEVDRFLARAQVVSLPVMPHSWMVETFLSIVDGVLNDAYFYTALLISTAIVSLQMVLWIAYKWYYPSWTRSLESGGTERRRSGTYRDVTFNPLFKLFPQDVRSLIVKDIRLFLRDPNQWGQLLIIATLLVVYIFNLANLPPYFDNDFWKVIISFLNFAFTGYVFATISVRFVFPSVSLEGHSFWSVGTAPIKIETLFWEKYMLAFLLSLAGAETLVTVSNLMLKADRVSLIVAWVGTFFVIAALTAINVGLGAVYPYFHEKNPSRIASTAGAMVSVIICVVYVLTVSALVGFLTWAYYGTRWTAFHATPEMVRDAVLAFVLIHLIAIGLPVRYGIRSLKYRDL
ncbi:MAG: hypothetical protein D6675_11875 [Gemmatimonadetes bacterium]|nr:MAG: hypothetical protein D6675_11875 [Gemmatimonadota bacterium]